MMRGKEGTMKKGFLAVFVMSALVMAIGFTACGSGGSASSAASSASSEAASAESSAASSEASSAASSAASTEAASAASSEASSAESSAAAQANGAAYGYAGTDPAEAAVYKHLVEETSKDYEKADASIPVVNIIKVDNANPDDVLVYGDFSIYNYNIVGDTLECVSGGSYPGVMHLKKDGEGYTVTSFDVVADGADFDSSARELFGDNYDAFTKVHSNDKARDELRKKIVSDYVKLNGLNVTQYQDYGWDPVQLDK